MKLVNADTIREMDRYTIETVGIPGIVLMEAAGRATAGAVQEISKKAGTDKVLIVCGPGNNGGDGFVVARHLADAQLDVKVLLLAEYESYRGDALTNLRILDKFYADVREAPRGLPDEVLMWAQDAIIVDAIFGTGLKRNLSGVFADTIDILNTMQGPAVAVDIPSGINSDTGEVMGTAFEADLTVTFAAAKIGQYVWPGRGRCGEIKVVPIGIPANLLEHAPGIFLMDEQHAAVAFGPRPRDSCKNTFGHVAVAGGMPGKTGASVMAGLAAARAGAGLTTIMTSDISACRIDGRFPDLMIEPLFSLPPEQQDTDGQTAAGESIHGFSNENVSDALAGKGATVIGPGLGQLSGTTDLIEYILASGIPAVLDADALNVISENKNLLKFVGPECIITPHPGEAARLLDISGTEVQTERLSVATRLAGISGAVTVLKGAGTIVASPDGRIAVSDHGSPALAVAGSGDVLSGIAGAMLARGIPSFDAACAAVTVHGIAGQLAAEQFGEHSVTATDLIQMLPRAIKKVDSGCVENGFTDETDA